VLQSFSCSEIEGLLSLQELRRRESGRLPRLEPEQMRSVSDAL
jgi:hypothetical protein